jgi:hypothetical protein
MPTNKGAGMKLFRKVLNFLEDWLSAAIFYLFLRAIAPGLWGKRRKR